MVYVLVLLIIVYFLYIPLTLHFLIVFHDVHPPNSFLLLHMNPHSNRNAIIQKYHCLVTINLFWENKNFIVKVGSVPILTSVPFIKTPN